MKAIKILGTFGVAVVVLFVFLANFSAVESRFQCPGQLSSTDGSRAITVFLKIQEYRWWGRLWSESNAAVHIEVPNTHVYYFGNVKKVGDQYQIFDSARKLRGNFSTLSNALAINLPLKLQTDFFDGNCRKSD